MFPGYSSRIDIELRKIYRENTLKFPTEKYIYIHINIIDSPRRKYPEFFGATILSNIYNIPADESYWISKKDWEESGPNIILKKCQNILR